MTVQRRSRRWTERERKQLKTMASRGIRAPMIARALERSPSAVAGYAVKHGISLVWKDRGPSQE